MPDEIRLAVAFLGSACLALVLMPQVRRLAMVTEFFDHPAGYKAHRSPTPYLGGTAVMIAFTTAAVLLGDGLSQFAPLLGGAALLWVVGTFDDRVGLGVGIRLVAQVGAAILLVAGGLGWELSGGWTLDVGITILWVVGLTNAFNLLDNMDGSSGTVGAVAAAGIGALAVIRGNVELGAVALSLSGALCGFLRYNLASPSQIFLGDGGSMPLGFLVAGMAIAVPHGDHGLLVLLAAAPLAGLAIFDTTLVVVSRRLRGAPVLRGGRDHVSHRLLKRLGTPRRVAVVVGLTQALLSGLAIALYGLDETVVLGVGIAYLTFAVACLIAVETPALAARAATAEG